MDKKEAIEILKKNKPTNDPRRCGTELCEAVDMAIEALQEPQVGGWIPVTYHTPKDEDEDMLYAYILDCPMPEEGQEILVYLLMAWWTWMYVVVMMAGIWIIVGTGGV